jgi:hypothetical protein
MFDKTIVRGFLAVVALVASVSNVRADNLPITYNFVNEPTCQNGWTMNGTITTDGNLGNITFADFLSTTLTFTDSSQNVTYPRSFSWNAVADGESGIVATPQAILLYPTQSVGQFPNTDRESGIELTYYIGQSEQEDTEWCNTGLAGSGYYAPAPWTGGAPSWIVPDDYYQSSGHWGNLWESYYDTHDSGVAPPDFVANAPWVIATAVPEPGTITLLVSALLGLAGAFYLRRRPAKA